MDRPEPSQLTRSDSKCDPAIKTLCELPPSAKLVAKTLEYNETLTQGQLKEETLLPPRTVRYALSRLEEHDLIESRFSFADARKRCYSLALA